MHDKQAEAVLQHCILQQLEAQLRQQVLVDQVAQQERLGHLESSVKHREQMYLLPAEQPQTPSSEERELSPPPGLHQLVVKNTFFDVEGPGTGVCPRPRTWACGLNLIGRTDSAVSQESILGDDDTCQTFG